jgi:hypothetical protein
MWDYPLEWKPNHPTVFQLHFTYISYIRHVTYKSHRFNSPDCNTHRVAGEDCEVFEVYHYIITTVTTYVIFHGTTNIGTLKMRLLKYY